MRHFNEGHSRKVEVSKSTWQLYGELFTTYRWNLFVGFMLHVIQQFTGINIIQYYGPAVLKDAGFAGDSNNDLLYSMIFLSSVNTVGNFIGLSLSSKYGRRELIMKSMIPMGISLIVLAGAMVVNTTMSSPVTRQCNNYVMINHFDIRYWVDLHCVIIRVPTDLLHWICSLTLDYMHRDFSSKRLVYHSKFS